jgi:hypothetical protein
MADQDQDKTKRPDLQGDPGSETVPAEKTVKGLGDVQISGESEEDAPTGGGAPADA